MLRNYPSALISVFHVLMCWSPPSEKRLWWANLDQCYPLTSVLTMYWVWEPGQPVRTRFARSLSPFLRGLGAMHSTCCHILSGLSSALEDPSRSAAGSSGVDCNVKISQTLLVAYLRWDAESSVESDKNTEHTPTETAMHPRRGKSTVQKHFRDGEHPSSFFKVGNTQISFAR